MMEFELASTFGTMYKKKRENLGYLIESPVPIRIMSKVYNVCIHYDLIAKIEDLPEDKKIELVNECRATGLKFTNESLRRSARILHALNYITNEEK